jgi:hypothetical protein
MQMLKEKFAKRRKELEIKKKMMNSNNEEKEDEEDDDDDENNNNNSFVSSRKTFFFGQNDFSSVPLPTDLNDRGSDRGWRSPLHIRSRYGLMIFFPFLFFLECRKLFYLYICICVCILIFFFFSFLFFLSSVSPMIVRAGFVRNPNDSFLKRSDARQEAMMDRLVKGGRAVVSKEEMIGRSKMFGLFLFILCFFFFFFFFFYYVQFKT